MFWVLWEIHACLCVLYSTRSSYYAFDDTKRYIVKGTDRPFTCLFHKPRTPVTFVALSWEPYQRHYFSDRTHPHTHTPVSFDKEHSTVFSQRCKQCISPQTRKSLRMGKKTHTVPLCVTSWVYMASQMTPAKRAINTDLDYCFKRTSCRPCAISIIAALANLYTAVISSAKQH